MSDLNPAQPNPAQPNPALTKLASKSALKHLRNELHSHILVVETKLASRITRLSDIVKFGFAAFLIVLAALGIILGYTKENIHDKVTEEVTRKVSEEVTKQMKGQAVQEAATSAKEELKKAQSSATQAAESAAKAADALKALHDAEKALADFIKDNPSLPAHVGDLETRVTKLEGSDKLPKLRAKVETLEYNLGKAIPKGTPIPVELSAPPGKKIVALVWDIQGNPFMKQFLKIQGPEGHIEPSISGNNVKVNLIMTDDHKENVWIQWVILYED